MAPKNKAKNSFYFFMKELQEKEAAKGRTVTMKTLPNMAHPIWTKMSLVEREPYEEMARLYKNDPNLRGGKLASDGTRVEDNLREIEELERRENFMMAEIKNYLDCISDDQFNVFASRKMFYFLSFNILCHTETEYIPIEVGAVEYSILHGIHREFHKIIYPGRIPTGYAGEAKRLSEEKHGIEIFGPEESSERDMTVVFNSIKKFLNPQDHGEFPPIFCLEEDIEQTRGCLRWLATKSRSRDEFDIWNCKYLLLELRAGAGYPLPSQTIASDLLTKTSFNYHPAARCEFHENKDIHYCALAYSKRLCYLLSDAVCNQFEVELTERHIPSQFAEDRNYVVTIYNNTSRTKRAPPAPTPGRLDQRSNYYQNKFEEHQFSDATEPEKSTPATPKQPNVPRQPASSSMAADMARLKLNMTAATVPGLGIGRGQRKIN